MNGAPWRQPISRGPPTNTERLPRSIADTEADRTKVQELIDTQHDVT